MDGEGDKGGAGAARVTGMGRKRGGSLDAPMSPDANGVLGKDGEAWNT